jgi:hypothetical protein
MFKVTRSPNALNTLILCQDGEFHSQMFVGQKVGMTARTWKTEAGAARVASRYEAQVVAA